MKTRSCLRSISFCMAVMIILTVIQGCERTDQGLLDPDTAGVWTLYNTANSGLPGNAIWDMAVDATGNLWMSCYGKGLAKYSNGTFTKYDSSNSGLVNNNVTALGTTPDGSVIVGTSDGVATLSATGVWTYYRDPLATTMEIYSVRKLSDGSVWVGTYNEGLYVNNSSLAATSGLTVYAFEEDKSGNVWMGTNAGLLVWNGSAWSNVSNTAGLPAGGVSSLLIDSKERIWIGVLDADRVYYRDRTGIHGLSLLTGLAQNTIWDICEDRNGDIWFATYNGGLIRYDGVVPHSYKEYNVVFDNGTSLKLENDVNCIARDNDGNMWFGLTSKGLVKYTLPLN